MIAISILLTLYVIVCGLLFVFQDKLIFFPQKLTKHHQFNFPQKFEEINIRTADQKLLHGLLFKTEISKGLIFYLHGNAGSLDGWGEVAETYTRLRYDVFLLDYRGYGKSEGRIQNDEQLYHDIQLAYNAMLKIYPENEIVVLGYSMGTGPAAKLASANQPRLLILQAPYYSLIDMMKHTVPFVPTFLLKYKLATHQSISGCKMPVFVIHGDQDEVIPYGQSLKLKTLFKDSDTLITLRGQTHNGMTHNPDYVKAIEKILRRK